MHGSTHRCAGTKCMVIIYVFKFLLDTLIIYILYIILYIHTHAVFGIAKSLDSSVSTWDFILAHRLLICIGSCHPLFFVHVVVITHTHMHTRTYVHTHWVIHTPTVACMDRPFWVGCPYQQPATGTGNQNAYNCVYFDDIISLIYAVLCDYSPQWWSLVWTTNSKRSTWACIHLPALHWCKTCTLRCYVCYPLYSINRPFH